MIDEKDESQIPKELTLDEKIKNKDIILNTDELSRVAEFIDDFDPKKDKYKRTLEAQGYVAARRANTGNYSHIAKGLGLPYGEFKYYLENKPEFAAAIRKGILDGKEELKDKLVDTLVKKAVGQTVEEVVVTEDYNFTSKNPMRTRVTTSTKVIPPDTQAALELLRQLDPTWRQKAQLDVNVNTEIDINVTENKFAAIDLASLSPQALEEILLSQKVGSKNMIANKREDGQSVRYLKDDVIEVEEAPKRKMSEETKEKIRQAHQKRKEGKEQKKKELEDKMKAEDLRNGEQ